MKSYQKGLPEWQAFCFWRAPHGEVTPVTGVKVLAHHPNISDFIEYFNAREARNRNADTTFCVRLCVRMKLWQIILSAY